MYVYIYKLCFIISMNVISGSLAPGTLEEMRCRAERASADADVARSEAAQAEAETAALAREIALLEAWDVMIHGVIATSKLTVCELENHHKNHHVSWDSM